MNPHEESRLRSDDAPDRADGGEHGDSPSFAATTRAAEYEPPAVTSLGSLAELTRGGDVEPNGDGAGFAGASGSI